MVHACSSSKICFGRWNEKVSTFCGRKSVGIGSIFDEGSGGRLNGREWDSEPGKKSQVPSSTRRDFRRTRGIERGGRRGSRAASRKAVEHMKGLMRIEGLERHGRVHECRSSAGDASGDGDGALETQGVGLALVLLKQWQHVSNLVLWSIDAFKLKIQAFIR
ncbi:hypothetical protein ONZ45_g2180 [Pleurotus djamor]|nr:hypothetical protein ONZ45_g2180 [Pleurotus djamor]